ncbi:hypothetical protein Tco_0401801 [Tanacetum coccineum]
MMGLPKETSVKVNSIKDAKNCWKLLKRDIGVQKLVSQFGLLDEKKLSQEDVKQKLLRSLYTRVEHTAVVWRNKADYGYKDHGDLYNQPQVIKARGTPNYQLMASSSSRPDSQENFLSPVESCQHEMVHLRNGETWMIMLDTDELRLSTLVPKDH